MKHFWITLLSMCMWLFSTAQTTVSKVVETYNQFTYSWDSVEVFRNHLDPNERIIESVHLVKDLLRNTWYLKDKDSMEYDASGRVLTQWEMDYGFNGARVVYQPTLYFYNSPSGPVDSTFGRGSNLFTDWFKSQSFRYNQFGDLLEELTWTNNPWRVTNRKTYTYGPGQTLLAIRSETYDESTGKLRDFYETHYRYGPNFIGIATGPFLPNVSRYTEQAHYLNSEGKPWKVQLSKRYIEQPIHVLANQYYTYNASGQLEIMRQENQDDDFPYAREDSFRERYRYNRPNESAPEITGTVRCYPNPARDLVLVELPQSEPYALELINAQGVAVMQLNGHEQVVKFSIEQLPTGIYWLRGEAGNLIVRTALIKP